MRDIAELETVLDYSFSKPDLLAKAMTHRSYANEHAAEGIEDNERLEFLGDAVLDLLVGHYLMDTFPDLSEGDLSMARAQMVSEAGLAKIAKELQLGGWLRLGRGEQQTGGRDKPSLLADAFEAMVAALYLDGSLEAANVFVRTRFAPYIPSGQGAGSDYKTRVQELVQRKWKTAPVYQLVGESGPAHDKLFFTALIVDGVEKARGQGRSKKAAEQNAAALAFARLSEKDS